MPLKMYGWPGIKLLAFIDLGLRRRRLVGFENVSTYALGVAIPITTGKKKAHNCARLILLSIPQRIYSNTNPQFWWLGPEVLLRFIHNL